MGDGRWAMGDVKMAWAVNGIDLVVGGRSQNPACMKAKNVLDRAYLPGTDCRLDRQNGTWVVQAHEWGKCVEWADFEYCNGDCKRVPYALIPINLNECGGPNAGRLRAFTQFAGLQLVITDGVVSRVRVRGETLEAGRSDRLVRIKFHPPYQLCRHRLYRRRCAAHLHCRSGRLTLRWAMQLCVDNHLSRPQFEWLAP
jgi:hypothetical protein